MPGYSHWFGTLTMVLTDSELNPSLPLFKQTLHPLDRLSELLIEAEHTELDYIFCDTNF